MNQYATLLLNSSKHKMQVLMDYSQIASMFNTHKAHYEYLVKMLFPMVRSWIQDNLSVLGNGKITPNFEKCSKVDVPTAIFNKEISADLVIIVTASNEPEKSYVAWASACQLNEVTFRPEMGRVNLNLAKLEKDFNKIYDIFGTVIHEITHILVMSPG